jgi:hypothetical protein
MFALVRRFIGTQTRQIQSKRENCSFKGHAALEARKNYMGVEITGKKDVEQVLL